MFSIFTAIRCVTFLRRSTAADRHVRRGEKKDRKVKKRRTRRKTSKVRKKKRVASRDVAASLLEDDAACRRREREDVQVGWTDGCRWEGNWRASNRKEKFRLAFSKKRKKSQARSDLFGRKETTWRTGARRTVSLNYGTTL